MSETTAPPPSPVPDIQTVTWAMLAASLRQGWRDFLAAPLFGLFFGGFYVLCGIGLFWLTQSTGQYYWLAIAVFGFPLLGPFAAVGLYEVSHRLDNGTPLNWGQILGVIWHQKNRQLPSICAIIILIFLFWSFIGHMIFALFLGLSTMTNISSSYEVFMTPDGLMMLGVGTVVGAGLAGLIFSITVMGLPLLLDREIDFVTAMIISVKTVASNARTMLVWGGAVAVMLFAGMMPFFLGLLVVLPVLGHATWHLYRQALR
ncbi:DUF2189 domain-containing protein [Actibacterium lipolyticum]|uniref:DUF2189 domain-containing protein n=1 Tax=Actibacterium lipolyticum TaxID=1524263 RepID=A0A238KIT4_9RHOB|nr:DUF2189 domain-containing protein [Actibacterium lipolyticum]SMX42769.1 hypothetical protein COL8621_02067 [Actibacterium lipolyticum]